MKEENDELVKNSELNKGRIEELKMRLKLQEQLDDKLDKSFKK